MEYLVDSQEMKRCDLVTINKFGMDSLVLIERAALSVVEELSDEIFDLRQVLVVCGGGNNGADGFAVARLLHLKKVNVHILFIGDEYKRTLENRKEEEIARNFGVQIIKEADCENYSTIIDALFGVGLSKTITGDYKDIIEQINHSHSKVLSLDIPSGISADTGKVMGVSVNADKTVTFAYKKLGLVLYPGAKYAGIVTVKDIGIYNEGFEDNLPKVYSYTNEDLNMIPKRDPYSNKGTFGKVLVIGGAVNMSGAAYFSAKAAYKTGAGLVSIYTPDENRQILQTLLPEAILSTYKPENIDFVQLKTVISWADVIIIGPGMGTCHNSKEILKFLLLHATKPLIIDADAINIIAKEPKLLKNHNHKIIITPHLGEMKRLINKDISEITDNLIEEAKNFAHNYKVTCVLKDARTVTTDENGKVYVNQSGNSGMATGGSGDILTGIIAGLLAQGMNLLDCAALGVYIHGLAGDKTAQLIGEYGMTANDIINNIQAIVR